MQILHPPGWAPARGYSNGVVATGRLVFLGGQIGWDGQQRFVSDDFIAQTEQALKTSSRCWPRPAAGRSTSCG
jgi:enamine deaminase RidA (YjgF/YER057c/UK114 family)